MSDYISSYGIMPGLGRDAFGNPVGFFPADLSTSSQSMGYPNVTPPHYRDVSMGMMTSSMQTTSMLAPVSANLMPTASQFMWPSQGLTPTGSMGDGFYNPSFQTTAQQSTATTDLQSSLWPASESTALESQAHESPLSLNLQSSKRKGRKKGVSTASIASASTLASNVSSISKASLTSVASNCSPAASVWSRADQSSWDSSLLPNDAQTPTSMASSTFQYPPSSAPECSVPKTGPFFTNALFDEPEDMCAPVQGSSIQHGLSTSCSSFSELESQMASLQIDPMPAMPPVDSFAINSDQTSHPDTFTGTLGMNDESKSTQRALLNAAHAKAILLTRDVRKYTTAEQAQFTCDKCGRLFARKSNFTAHQKIHDPNHALLKQYLCPRGNCKSFSKMIDCKRHIYSCFKLGKLYPCPCQECGKMFARADICRRHVKTSCAAMKRILAEHPGYTVDQILRTPSFWIREDGSEMPDGPDGLFAAQNPANEEEMEIPQPIVLDRSQLQMRSMESSCAPVGQASMDMFATTQYPIAMGGHW